MEEIAFLPKVECVLKDKTIGSDNLGKKEYNRDSFIDGCS